MKKLIYSVLTITIIILFFSINSCKKEEPYNPFDNQPSDTTKIVLEKASIEGLYQNVFKPNCSASACHDGSNSPDFSTIESSYNTLVFNTIAKNYLSNPLSYRVVPNDALNSMLIRRLEGNSNGLDQMPTHISADWEANKTAHIKDIKDWINNGAKDIFGNEPTSPNLKPYLTGFYITEAGDNTPFNRNAKGYITIPSTVNSIDIYIGIDDKETSASDLDTNRALLSVDFMDFSNASVYSMNIISAISETGYSGNPTDFYHKITINNIGTKWLENQFVFLKVEVSDGTNPLSNLPGTNILKHLKYYYSFKRIP